MIDDDEAGIMRVEKLLDLLDLAEQAACPLRLRNGHDQAMGDGQVDRERETDRLFQPRLVGAHGWGSLSSLAAAFLDDRHQHQRAHVVAGASRFRE